MANRDKLVREAYAQLTADGQEPSAEDYAVIKAAIDGKIGELQNRKVIGVIDPGDFDDALLEYLAVTLSSSLTLTRKFGAQPDASSIAFAEQRLKELTRGTYVPNPLRVCYF